MSMVLLSKCSYHYETVHEWHIQVQCKRVQHALKYDRD